MPCLAQFFQTWGAMIQTVFLLATLIVIIVYTIKTHQMKEATVEQNELQLRPCVIVSWESDFRGIKFNNIGNSPALNIKVMDIEIGKYIYRFEKRGLLMPNKTTSLSFIKVGKNDPENTRYESEISLRLIDSKEFTIEILYENIKNRQYFSKLKVFPLVDKTEFLETDKTKKYIKEPRK